MPRPTDVIFRKYDELTYIAPEDQIVHIPSKPTYPTKLLVRITDETPKEGSYELWIHESGKTLRIFKPAPPPPPPLPPPRPPSPAPPPPNERWKYRARSPRQIRSLSYPLVPYEELPEDLQNDLMAMYEHEHEERQRLEKAHAEAQARRERARELARAEASKPLPPLWKRLFTKKPKPKPKPKSAFALKLEAMAKAAAEAAARTEEIERMHEEIFRHRYSLWAKLPKIPSLHVVALESIKQVKDYMNRPPKPKPIPPPRPIPIFRSYSYPPLPTSSFSHLRLKLWNPKTPVIPEQSIPEPGQLWTSDVFDQQVLPPGVQFEREMWKLEFEERTKMNSLFCDKLWLEMYRRFMATGVVSGSRFRSDSDSGVGSSVGSTLYGQAERTPDYLNDDDDDESSSESDHDTDEDLRTPSSSSFPSAPPSFCFSSPTSLMSHGSRRHSYLRTISSASSLPSVHETPGGELKRQSSNPYFEEYEQHLSHISKEDTPPPPPPPPEYIPCPILKLNSPNADISNPSSHPLINLLFTSFSILFNLPWTLLDLLFFFIESLHIPYLAPLFQRLLNDLGIVIILLFISHVFVAGAVILFFVAVFVFYFPHRFVAWVFRWGVRRVCVFRASVGVPLNDSDDVREREREEECDEDC